MRTTLIFCLLMIAGTAEAHVGHITGVAGHDHWAIGAAIGAIAVAGLLGALKGRKKPTKKAEPEGEPA